MEQAAGEKPEARRRKRGEQLELEIDSLAFGGRGSRATDGLVVFVAGALPGDRVRAEITKAKKRFAEARAVELLRPGADRLADTCVHGGEPCPGAPWQGLPYERQLEHKQRAGRRGAAADRRPRRLRAGADRAGRASSGATATSSSTPSAQATTRSRRSASTPAAAGTWSSTSRTAISPPRPATPPATRSATGPGWSRSPPTTAARARASCATSSSARGAAPARSRPAWSPPRRRFSQPPVDLHTIDRGRLAAAPTARPARSARSACARSSAACSWRCPTAPSSRPTPRWPSASTASPPSSPG